MNVRYASIVVLLSSALGLGLSFLWPNQPVAQDAGARMRVVVPVAPLATALEAFLDPSEIKIESLKEGGGDVHHIHLSPSQRRKLRDADIAMAELPAEDPHIWLSISGLRGFISGVTARMDVPSQNRAEAFLGARSAWVRDQRVRFAAVTQTPFVVDHDAFHGFEDDMGLKGKLGALSGGHDQPIGAKGLKALRDRVAGKQLCVLHAPHANTQRITTMLDGATLVFMEADPLLWNDPSYANGMTRLADAFYSCLSKAAR